MSSRPKRGAAVRSAGKAGENAKPESPSGTSAWTLGIVAFVCLLVGGGAGFLVARPQATRTQATPAPEARRATPSQAPALRPTVPPPEAEPQPTARIDDKVDLLAAPSAPQAGFQHRVQLTPPFDAINSIMFDSADLRIKLARVAAVGREQVCKDDDGKRLACGLMARAALQNFLRGKSVECDPLFVPRDRQRGVIEANCWVNGEDLALRQISAGFAFPWRLATEKDHEALAAARANRLGVWAGPQDMPTSDASDSDAAAIPFGSTRLPWADFAPAPANAPGGDMR